MAWIIALVVGSLVALAVLVRAGSRSRPSSPRPAPLPAPLPPHTNRAPRVQIRTPTAGALGAPVAVAFELHDDESDLCTVEARYSTDGGTTFQVASAAGGGTGVM